MFIKFDLCHYPNEDLHEYFLFCRTYFLKYILIIPSYKEPLKCINNNSINLYWSMQYTNVSMIWIEKLIFEMYIQVFLTFEFL